MSRRELLHGLFDDLDAAILPHLLRGEVGVRARSVPITLDRLWIQRRAHPKVFTHAIEKPASQPQFVGNFQSSDRPNLELPLRRHDLGVGPFDMDSGPKAGRGM